MATHSSSFAWEIPWTEEPGGLQVHGSQKTWTWLTKQQQSNFQSDFLVLFINISNSHSIPWQSFNELYPGCYARHFTWNSHYHHLIYQWENQASERFLKLCQITQQVSCIIENWSQTQVHLPPELYSMSTVAILGLCPSCLRYKPPPVKSQTGLEHHSGKSFVRGRQREGPCG